MFSRTSAQNDEASNSEESEDESVGSELEKRPQYKSIMNNIRRGIRTDDETSGKKRVCVAPLSELEQKQILMDFFLLFSHR